MTCLYRDMSFFLTNGNVQNYRGINELQINKNLMFTGKKKLKEAQGILKKKEGKRTCFFRLSRFTVKPSSRIQTNTKPKTIKKKS